MLSVTTIKLKKTQKINWTEKKMNLFIPLRKMCSFGYGTIGLIFMEWLFQKRTVWSMVQNLFEVLFFLLSF